MYLWNTLHICVVFLFSQSFYKGVGCALVTKPWNVAAVSGEVITLHCASDGSKGNIAWSINNLRNFIYNDYVLASSVSSYISVSDRDDGSCSLNVNTSVIAAAKRYICSDRDSGEAASAELVVLEDHMKCDSKNLHGSVAVKCSVVSAGNWAPSVECIRLNKDPDSLFLLGTRSAKFHNEVVTHTWMFNSTNELDDVCCWTKFVEYDRPKETSATNIPEFVNRTLVYQAEEPETNRFWEHIAICSMIFACVTSLLVLLCFMRMRRSRSRSLVLLPTTNLDSKSVTTQTDGSQAEKSQHTEDDIVRIVEF